ncbi:MAG: 5'-deoxyadenosine deaminase [Calditrichia bacterium]
MGTLLKNALVVTQNSKRDIFTGDVLIIDQKIARVGKDLPAGGHTTIDLTNRILIPGFVQTHVHLCQTLFRNLADDLELLDWLKEYIWPMEMAHTPETLRASAQLGLSEMLLGGTTTILDMGNGAHQEVIFEEMLHSGIRGFSGQVLMDTGAQPYKQTTGQALAESRRLINDWHFKKSSRIGYALAPRFVPSCSKELWEGVRDLSERYNLIIHTHASENRTEWQMVHELTGYSNVDFFMQRGMASPRLCLAHCIWISPEEIDFMAEAGINVLHCPSANLKLGSGIAPIPELYQAGVNIGLGADGAACNNNLDIFMEMRLAALIQKPRTGVKSTNARMIFDMANINGAKALGLENQIGSIEEGKLADLVVLNLNKVHCTPADNVISQIVYSANSGDVEHVIIDGQWVVKNKTLLPYSTDEVVENAWEQIHRLFEEAK